MHGEFHSDEATISFESTVHLTYVKRMIHSNEMVRAFE